MGSIIIRKLIEETKVSGEAKIHKAILLTMGPQEKGNLALMGPFNVGNWAI